MDREAVIRQFFQDVIKQNEAGLKRWFREDAVIRWHCTNEQFTVSEYIQANCEYPGRWEGNIERSRRRIPRLPLPESGARKTALPFTQSPFTGSMGRKSHPWRNTGETTVRLPDGGLRKN